MCNSDYDDPEEQQPGYVKKGDPVIKGHKQQYCPTCRKKGQGVLQYAIFPIPTLILWWTGGSVFFLVGGWLFYDYLSGVIPIQCVTYSAGSLVLSLLTWAHCGYGRLVPCCPKCGKFISWFKL
jgi:hypothetical protein